MKKRHWPIAAAIILLPVFAFAQTQETMPQKQDSHSDGTAPEGRGSTGWTGGTGGSHIGTNTDAEKEGAGAQSSGATGAGDAQPPNAPLGLETATGLDLNGPPVRFPTNKTPE